jgi:hypothetical protein
VKIQTADYQVLMRVRERSCGVNVNTKQKAAFIITYEAASFVFTTANE